MTFGIITAPIPVQEEVYTVPEPIEITIEQEETIELFSELEWICTCEGGRDSEGNLIHYGEDGELLRGRVNPLDRGMCQINEYYWGDLAEELGLDWLNNENDYIELANYIYANYGAFPWRHSNYCHSALD